MTNQPSSPPCGAAEADDVYIGYAGRNELLLVLNELLEAERAGAKVALASTKAVADDYAALMRQVRDDEAHWCEMLDRQIRRLGGTRPPWVRRSTSAATGIGMGPIGLGSRNV